MVAGLKTGVDVYVRLARLALETYVKERKIINPWEVMPPLPREMMENRAGTFVS